MKYLQIHFIWCGSDGSKIIEDLLTPKIISLKYFFRNSGYDLVFNLWVDRFFRGTILENMRYKLKVNLTLKDIFELFIGVEKSNNINYYNRNRRFLRYLFSDESGSISTYNEGGGNFFKGTNSHLGNRFKPMPAIAADIIKALLGFQLPGLYIDIGLDFSETNESLNLNKILDYKNCFKEDVFFAATPGVRNLLDYQIMYSTDNDKCQKIFKKVIETYYKMGNIDTLSKNISHNDPSRYFRTYNLHSSEFLNYSSSTCTIWKEAFSDPTLKSWVYDRNDNIKENCLIPIDYTKGSIAEFVYKDRKNSPIEDYKKSIQAERILSKYRSRLF